MHVDGFNVESCIPVTNKGKGKHIEELWGFFSSLLAVNYGNHVSHRFFFVTLLVGLWNSCWFGGHGSVGGCADQSCTSRW